jgi:outer membrane protein assembly factor BamE
LRPISLRLWAELIQYHYMLMIPRLRSTRRMLPLAFAAALAACKSVEVPKVPGITPYRMVIQQGNYVSPEMVAQLKPGMTKEQVRYVLGTPLLTDIFHADRWDYVFYREMPDGSREQRNLSVIFEDGKLARVIGDLLPPEGAAAAKPAEAKPAAETKPAAEAKPAAGVKPEVEAPKEQPAAAPAPKGTTQNWRAASDVEAEKERAEAAGKPTVSADEAAKEAAPARPTEDKSEEDRSGEAKKERGFFGRLLEKIGL